VSLLLGYGMAVTVTIQTIGIMVFPVIGLVVLGTFFLYSQLSIIVLQLLKRNKKLFYNKSNILIISQLGYKIKDNARILFTITILWAFVITAMGTIYVIQMARKQGLNNTPYALAWTEIADPDIDQLERKQLDEL